MDDTASARLQALNDELNLAINEIDVALEGDEERQLEMGTKVNALSDAYKAFVLSLDAHDRGVAEKRLDRRMMDLRRQAARLTQRVSGRTTNMAKDAGSVPFLLQRDPGRSFDFERAVPKGHYTVGGEVEAWCGKCKDLREHRIVAMVGPDPKQVVCGMCGSRHNFRTDVPARRRNAAAETENTENYAEPYAMAAPRRAADREAELYRENKRKLQVELAAVENPRVFDPKQRYKAGEVIQHPELGRGKVESVLRSSMLVRFFEGLRPVNLQ